MLYIKFQILSNNKFADFQKLYQHLLEVRTPGFEFADPSDNVDWETITPEEMAFLFDEGLQQEKRYNEFFPNYANMFLEQYLKSENGKLGVFGSQNVYSIMNYLEHDFEVEIDNLEKIKENSAVIEFSTGNYPFGGLERFLMVLKSFDLIPDECYDGFTVGEFNWVSDFEYHWIELFEKTEVYLNHKSK